MATRTNVDIELRAKDKASKEVKKTEKSLGSLEKSTGSLIGKLAGVAAAAAIAGIALAKAFDAVMYAAQVQQTRMSFESIAADSGVMADQVIDNMRRMSGETINELDMMLAANRANLLGLPVDKFDALMAIARASATATGGAVKDMFSDIVVGIGRASPMILDNLGIIVKIGKANDDYAVSIGKTVKQLTDQEKKMALLNAVLVQGEEIIRKVGEAGQTVTAAEYFQQATAAADDLKATVGELLLPVFINFSTVVTKTLRAIRSTILQMNAVRDAMKVDAIKGDLSTLQKSYDALTKQIEMLTSTQEGGMKTQGRSRKETEAEITALGKQREAIAANIYWLELQAIQTETNIDVVKDLNDAFEPVNIWKSVHGLEEYGKWLDKLYQQTEQAQLDKLWIQVERAQANLVVATGEEADELNLVIDMLHGKILAQSKYIDGEAEIMAILDEENERRKKLREEEEARIKALADVRKAAENDFAQLYMTDMERSLSMIDAQKDAFIEAGLSRIEVELWYQQAQEETYKRHQKNTDEIEKQAEILAGFGIFQGAAESFAKTEVGKVAVGEELGLDVDPLMDAITAMADAFLNVTSILALFNPIKTLLQGMMSVLSPLIDEVLAPIIGILRVVGNVLGQLLVPAFKILGLATEAIGRAFVWLYNWAIRPLGNFVIFLIVKVGNFFIGIMNAVIWALNKIPFVNIRYVQKLSYENMKLEKISYADLVGAGGEGAAEAGAGAVGSTTSIQRAPDIYIYITIDGSVYGAGGPLEVGEQMARALEEYAGIGGRIHIAEALA